jgi:hypothetical protein
MPRWSVTLRTRRIDNGTIVLGTQTWVLRAEGADEARRLVTVFAQGERARRHRRYAVVELTGIIATRWRSLLDRPVAHEWDRTPAREHDPVPVDEEREIGA